MASSSSMPVPETDDEREALKRQLAAALDDLVANGRLHAARIQEPGQREHPTRSAAGRVRETPLPYQSNRSDERLDRLERALTDISNRMAANVDLEALRDEVTRVRDGCQDTQQRLERVANLFKTFVVRG